MLDFLIAVLDSINFSKLSKAIISIIKIIPCSSVRVFEFVRVYRDLYQNKTIKLLLDLKNIQ